MTSSKLLVNANQATAKMAYGLNEIALIYPITPASEMAELSEQWASEGLPNLFGDVPMAIQMQGEGGVAGAMHGALQTGSLTTTFTASQGLLLMLPNLYKIAGQLLPNVIHVATRSIATHSLSVFGDHSDIMAVRQCGYAFLGSANVQEAYDFALIAQLSTLESSIPFIHFFDGFRTSHELNTISAIKETVIKNLIDDNNILKFYENSLSPKNPSIRGTAQGADTFFEGRERTNNLYNQCAYKVADIMEQFGKLTGRYYQPFEYVGRGNAEHIIVAMGSATDTIEYAIKSQANIDKVGLIKVKLYRPFSTDHFLHLLPSSCKSITVLDRTKEPGANGEPLYLDVLESVRTQNLNNKINVINGRYGLSSKEFNPQMVMAIIQNAQSKVPKKSFTIGIDDDITNSSLAYNQITVSKDSKWLEVIINDTDKKLTKNLQKVLTDSKVKKHIQSYTGCSYKKYNASLTTHIRFSNEEIKAPFLIDKVDVLVIDSLDKLNNHDLLQRLEENSNIIAVITENENNTKIKNSTIKSLKGKKIELFTINAQDDSIDSKMKQLIVGLQSNDGNIREYCESHYNRMVLMNSSTENLNQPQSSTASIKVSDMPINGVFELSTFRTKEPENNEFIPQWDTEACVECGLCSLVCPQAALRMKMIPNNSIYNLPLDFPKKEIEDTILSQSHSFFSIQVEPDQCNSCNICVEQCPTNALVDAKKEDVYQINRLHWDDFEKLPEADRELLNPLNLFQQQFMEPLFRYPENERRCTESPYIKLLTQLFGDRLLMANATGSSSIFGGAIDSPFYKNKNGNGPAWANSLFEDNAEFGFGFHITQKFQLQKAKRLLFEMMDFLPDSILGPLLLTEQNSEKNIIEVKKAVEKLKAILLNINTHKARALYSLADVFIENEIWIVGGDGWAYDIGFGGIDHVVASGENVNILILDNEGYSNTGGQASKATPKGKRVKFAHSGKKQAKKDLGAMLSAYPNTQVINVSIFDNPVECLAAIATASKHNGPTVILADCIYSNKNEEESLVLNIAVPLQIS